eukprot:TRINITY_DN180_c0_g1_i2.p1 TRINITY_DN180_c0_g1~~TRINITY_DN180_c0_g1_i2.p1  ORF type:complete len:392 (-),score=40.36 TRINITY_DN180_c0_g1_i2:853-2028(-)
MSASGASMDPSPTFEEMQQRIAMARGVDPTKGLVFGADSGLKDRRRGSDDSDYTLGSGSTEFNTSLESQDYLRSSLESQDLAPMSPSSYLLSPTSVLPTVGETADRAAEAARGLEQEVCGYRTGGAEMFAELDVLPFEDVDISGWRPRSVLCPDCQEYFRPHQRTAHQGVCSGAPASAKRCRARRNTVDGVRSVLGQRGDDYHIESPEPSPTREKKSPERGRRMMKVRRATWSPCSPSMPSPVVLPSDLEHTSRELSLEDSWAVKNVESPEDLEMLCTLGVGSYGTVRMCRVKESGKAFSVKILSKNQLLDMSEGEEEKIAHRCMLERIILGDMDHPFIVQLHHTFQCEHFLYMLMEFVPGGELFYHLRRATMFPNVPLRCLTRSLLVECR